MTNLELKRLAETSAAARVAAPKADLGECSAALLVMVFDETIREHLKATQPRLWVQVLHALGPITPPADASLDAAGL